MFKPELARLRRNLLGGGAESGTNYYDCVAKRDVGGFCLGQYNIVCRAGWEVNLEWGVTMRVVASGLSDSVDDAICCSA